MKTQQSKEVLVSNAQKSVSAYLEYTGCEKDGHLLEHFYNLTASGFEQHEDHGSVCYDYEVLCMELLVLLTNPKISSLLPEDAQKNAGTLLAKLVTFFEHVGDNATKAAMELLKVENYYHCHTEEEIAEIDEYYQKQLERKISVA